jgi:hypothetical protein
MFQPGEKFGVLTWDWKANGPTGDSVRRMKEKGLVFRNDVPGEIIYQDCFAAIFTERNIAEDEVIWAWEQYDCRHAASSYIDETEIFDIFEVQEKTWEEKHKEV